MLRPILLLAFCAALGGCGAISALSTATAPTRGFELRLPDAMPRATSTSARHVIVEIPETSGGLTSDGVMIRPDRVEAAFLSGAQWTDDLPLMVQTLLLRALEASDGYSFVGREPLGLSGDYAILTELVDFQGEVLPALPDSTADAPRVEAKVTLLIRIIRERDARIMGARRFSRSQLATSDDPGDVARALDGAMGALLPEISRWIMGRTGLRVAR